MISLDQIQLLEKKVETAVVKIAELQKENDFLRNKFSELKVQNEELQQSNTELTAKLSLYEQNQPRIEQGIMNALQCLNNVEDSVLRAGVAKLQNTMQPQTQEQSSAQVATTTETVEIPSTQVSQEVVQPAVETVSETIPQPQTTSVVEPQVITQEVVNAQNTEAAPANNEGASLFSAIHQELQTPSAQPEQSSIQPDIF